MRYANENGFFELNSFPGCNQIVVSNHSYVNKEQRGKGLGDLYHKQRLELIKTLGYDYSICTVKETNTAQIKILEKNNWKHLDTFINKETENTIKIYGKIIS